MIDQVQIILFPLQTPLIFRIISLSFIFSLKKAMQLIRGYRHLTSQHQGCVATIGNFDGVHLGHQAVFNALIEQAKKHHCPSVVITFEPQSKEFFIPDKAPARITRLREKLDAIKKTGIDWVLLLEFNPHLAQLSAPDFIQKILVDGLAIRYLYVGDDFRFGTKRQGDFALLEKAGKQFHFEVASLPTVRQNQHRISSSLIREYLTQGNLSAAEQALGHPYQICGRVVYGDQRGRTIGFPTANIDLKQRISPLKGVFAVKVRGLASEPLDGVANLGTRPTIRGQKKYLLETHLFDFNQAIYGKRVGVEFVARIRDEQKFASFDALKQQIVQDCISARQLLLTDNKK